MLKFTSLIFLVFVLFTQAVWAESIFIVLSEQADAYIKAGNAIRTSIHAQSKQIDIQISDLESIPDNFPADSLLIPVGDKASTQLSNAKLSNAIIYSFIKAQSLSHLSGEWTAVVTDQPVPRLVKNAESVVNHHNWSAAVLDQPVSRLVSSIDHIANTDFKKRIVIAHYKSNPIITEQLKVISPKQSDIDIIALSEPDKPAKQIEDKLFNAGALIAVNDEQLWQGNNAKWMLYQAYRYKVPVVGYSKKFLKAGALISVYSTVEHIASSVAQQVLAWSKTKKLPQKGIIYSDYNIEFNQNIARALNISVPENKFDLKADQ